MRAPASYVAGLGRGASGFTTRSDIGPAREGPSEEVVDAAKEARGEELEADPDRFQDPENETGLFAGAFRFRWPLGERTELTGRTAGMVYEADDEEADRIYEAVDAKIDERRKAKREAREKEEEDKFRAERPTIQSQFADLKRGLADMTDAEWDSLRESRLESRFGSTGRELTFSGALQRR